MKIGIKVAGFGGQGVQLLGTMIAYTAMLEGKHVTFVPSYGPESRGGTSNCYITISERQGESPLVDRPDVMITMNLPSMSMFEPAVKRGGLLIYNSSLTPKKPARPDIKILAIPATELADKMGKSLLANMIVLGAFAERTRIISAKTLVESTLPDMLHGKKEMIPIDEKAISEGAAYAKENS